MGVHYPPTRPNGQASPIARVMRRVRIESPDGCWIWMGALKGGGYGHINTKGRHFPVHRVAYEALVGPIPVGLQLDHLCRTRTCVNPAHLEPVTARENSHRGARWTTHCSKGHERTPETTAWDAKTGGRHCRPCSKASAQAWWITNGPRVNARRQAAKTGGAA